jgi:hypothetical protein
MTILHSWRRAGFISLCGLLSVIGCSDGEQPTPSSSQTAIPVEELSVSLLFAPETSQFVHAASDAFNRVKNTLADGAVIKLVPVQATAADMGAFLEQHPLEPFLWLSSSTMEAESTKIQLEPKGIGQTRCESLFFTAPTFAYRGLDSFAFGSEERPPDLSLFLERDQGSNTPEPILVTGHPLLSPSGSVAAAMLISAASGVSYPELRADTVAAYAEKLNRLDRRIVHQFADDQAMLDWLASREGGVPILALTTRQQLRSFSKRLAGTQLSEAVAPLSPFDLDYPLCVVEPAHSPSRHQQALRIARGFLLSAHVAPFIEAAGFSDKRPGRPPSEQISRPSLEGIVRSRSAAERENWTSLVFDTSIAVERTLLDSTRKLVSHHLFEATHIPFSTSVMSCSTTPELLVRSTKTPKIAAEALEKLRVSGGFAFGDCLLQALESASESDIKDKRKTVLVFTRGRETSNVTALNELKQIIPRRLSRTQTVLYVVSIAHKPGENATFESHARSLGAVIVPTTPRTLSDTVTKLLAELS